MKNRTKFLIIILSIIFLIVMTMLFIILFNQNITKKHNVATKNEILIDNDKAYVDTTEIDKISNIDNNYNKNEVDKNSSIESENPVNEIYEGIDYKEDLSKYYYSKNWFIEDKVVDEKKETLPFFDRLDGKVAKVTKTINRKYKWLTDINDEDTYIKDSFVLVPIATSSEYAYKYYFDSDGYLIRDNISKDWTILDYIG